MFRKAVPNMPLACWVLGCSAASSVGSYAQTPRFIAKFEGNALPQARATEVQHPAGTAQGVAAAGVPASVKDTDAASMHTHVDQVCVYYTPKHSVQAGSCTNLQLTCSGTHGRLSRRFLHSQLQPLSVRTVHEGL